MWVPRVSGKRGARELERASSQSYSARNCDIYPVPRRFPVDRQPHSHRFCASTGDRKSNHQVAPIVCSQFALLSPDSATSQQYIALYLRQQCLHVEKDVFAPRLLCSQLLLTCFTLSLRQSASVTACGGEYVNGQRPITANGDYRLQYSHWTLTHQPFSDLDYRRLQVEHLHLVLDTYALHVRPPQQVDVRSQGSIGRAPLYPVGVRGARYHGQGSWAGECGSPGSLGKRGARELERASSQSYSARNCDIHPVPRRFPVARQPHSHR